MRKCSEIKRLNGDNRFRSELNEMLNLCHQSGHRPVRGTDMFRRLASIEHAMYIRTTKNILVPSDIMALISDIKAFPSLAEKQQAETIIQAKKEQDAFDARYQKVVEIFPLVKQKPYLLSEIIITELSAPSLSGTAKEFAGTSNERGSLSSTPNGTS